MFNIYEYLEQEFKERVYQWKIGDTYLQPTAVDIEQVVDKAIADLYDEPDGSIVETGRLCVQKNGTHYDIYLHIGEVK